MKTLAVIPARYASSRLPGKALIPIAGVPLVIRVLSNVQKCKTIDKVVVATDDSRIADAVRKYGGDVIMTPADLPSGGDRVAWVSREIPSEFVLNVQVDDPLVNSEMIDPLVVELERDSSIMLALLAKRIEKMEEVVAESCVKMVFDKNGRAMYFSRSPIPYPIKEDGIWFKHIGPYAWRRDFLLEFSSWEQTPLEKAESLEMLRVLEKGYSIKCVLTENDTIEIDTPRDLEKIESYFAQCEDLV
ncbi:MAG: 3-deoxy-manno-octulosonate cytidylyltransferase [Synergistaceae bacterium]|jgi:3-deoxy-manno-octulosonate cytidylyltransferase (CMP-KDO synthetase)|nr:3-deoxy-manno-octulosonate cytidylyltransferase [Synergistaceae bacterium]